MKSFFNLILIALCTLALDSGTLYAAETTKTAVAYPDGYRSWTHVKSMVIQKGHPLFDMFGGIHHIYANKKAVKAMKKGATYPDGSILVFDLLEATAEGSAVTEGPRKIIGVMHKNSRTFSATGGWGFEGFKGDTRQRIVTDSKTACFSCHASEKKTDYVFGSWRR